MKKFINNIINNFKRTSHYTKISSKDRNDTFKVKYHNTCRISDQVLFLGMNHINKNVYINGEINIGYGTTMNEECWLHGNIEIGRYTQLGPRVCIYANNHNMNLITPYNAKYLLSGKLKKHIIRKKVRIGNSVWIGYGAIILPGVSIGDGSIIGAGTVITKDVAEYSIVAGNPGKEIKKRFNEKIIDAIKHSKWWEKDIMELEDYSNLFNIDVKANPQKFINELHSKK